MYGLYVLPLAMGLFMPDKILGSAVAEKKGITLLSNDVRKLAEVAVATDEPQVDAPEKDLRGEIIKAFISLRSGYEPSEALMEDIRKFVKEGLAAHAAPREIEFRDKLPKTRSGKIMRRVLKAWELGLPTGDLSTMEDDGKGRQPDSIEKQTPAIPVAKVFLWKDKNNKHRDKSNCKLARILQTK